MAVVFFSGQRLLLPPIPKLHFAEANRATPSIVRCSDLSNRSRRSSSINCSNNELYTLEEKHVDVDGLVNFLYDDLPHLFDDKGIDRTMYDDRVKFLDPITKHDGIDGYLFNIWLLRSLFSPDFQLHHVKRTGPLELTTRWTMVMKFALLPWKPEVIFTGTSIMEINPKTHKFSSHVDIWDSIRSNDYFSFEGLLDFVKQLRYYKTPDLDTPKYRTLKRTADYEVREYYPFLVVETKGNNLSGSGGFNDVTGYIFGKNTSSEKIPMTTPVFTQQADKQSGVSIQVVLPLDKELGKLPDPLVESVGLRKVEGGFAASLKFSGKPTEDVVQAKERKLRSLLLRDGLKPQEGCVLARYNDPRTNSFIMNAACSSSTLEEESNTLQVKQKDAHVDPGLEYEYLSFNVLWTCFSALDCYPFHKKGIVGKSLNWP